MAVAVEKKRQRSRLSAAFALPKWVTAGQARRLARALTKDPALDIDIALMQFAREPATTG
jgi:hypothetical protein